MLSNSLTLVLGGLLAASQISARPQPHPHGRAQGHVDKRAASATWSYVGCVTDGGSRALTGPTQINGGMTVEMCTAYCQAANYVYAGLEAKNQCYCGNTLSNGQGTVVAASQCTYTCAGDSSQACGGYYKLNLWKSSLAPATTFSTSMSSTSTKASSTSTSTSAKSTSTSTTTTKASTTSTATSKAATTTTSSTTSISKVTSTSASTSKAAAVATSTSVSATLLGCYTDSGSSRTLTGTEMESSSLTPSMCASYCFGKGYTYSGLEYSKQCWCGSSLDSSRKTTTASCSYKCSGDSSSLCGGYNVMSIYSLTAGGTTTSMTSNSTSAKASTTASTTSTTATLPASASTIGVATPPSATGTKALYAHHMVGNTYSYTQATWADDISQAYAAGIDGFALNYGSDYWQPGQLASAYAAANAQKSFKLFLSMDVSSLGCSSTTDMTNLVNTVALYANNTAQATYEGAAILSTFSGADCTFGYSSSSTGWTAFRSSLAARNVSIYFLPAIFSDPSTFSADSWMEGEFNWNGAWPMGSTALDTSSDSTYMSALGNKTYMAAMSPAFFTYYGPNSYNKDWIYRSDDWLLARRFEQLIAMRSKIDLIELISWNDYGESHYIGPIRTDQPNSQGWTNGMPHTAWLDLVSYYAQAWKKGTYPTASDQMIFWTRPHPKAATPSAPTNPRPNFADYTDDYLYAWVALKSAATVTLTAGSNSTASWSLPAGVSKLSLKSTAGAIGGKIVRSSATVKTYDSTGTFTYVATPTDYNFNYFVASV